MATGFLWIWFEPNWNSHRQIPGENVSCECKGWGLKWLICLNSHTDTATNAGQLTTCDGRRAAALAASSSAASLAASSAAFLAASSSTAFLAASSSAAFLAASSSAAFLAASSSAALLAASSSAAFLAVSSSAAFLAASSSALLASSPPAPVVAHWPCQSEFIKHHQPALSGSCRHLHLLDGPWHKWRHG